MRHRIFRAVVVWKDGEVEDADEITVYAPDEARAKIEAKKRWRLTVAVKWPHCRMTDVAIRGSSPPH